MLINEMLSPVAAITNPVERGIYSEVGPTKGGTVGRIRGMGVGGGAHIDGVGDGVGVNVPGVKNCGPLELPIEGMILSPTRISITPVIIEQHRYVFIPWRVTV